jgi:hypothetical protein
MLDHNVKQQSIDIGGWQPDWTLDAHEALTDIGVGSPRPDLDDLAEDIAWARHLLGAQDDSPS